MSRRATIRKSDIAAVLAAGLTISRIIARADGVEFVTIDGAGATEPTDAGNPWDKVLNDAKD